MKATTKTVSKASNCRTTFRVKKAQTVARRACIVPDKRMLGKFVALRSFVDNTVVAFGTDAGTVIKRAQGKGVATPVVMFIPPRKMVCMY